MEAEPEADVKEESDEDEEEDEESERLRFKTERKDSTVVRLSDATNKRRNIPETLGTAANGAIRLSTFTIDGFDHSFLFIFLRTHRSSQSRPAGVRGEGTTEETRSLRRTRERRRSHGRKRRRAFCIRDGQFP